MRALLGLFIVTQLVLLAWLSAPRERVERVETRTLSIVRVPAPLPIETIVDTPVDHAFCPPPRRDFPRGALVQPPEPVDRVKVAWTNTGWVAAWNARDVYVSRDGGASWTRAVDGGTGDVRDVHFDCFGHPIVARGSIPHLADDGDLVVLGGGPDIAMIGAAPRNKDDPWRARLVVSRDGGVTWQRRDLVEYWETPVYGRQYEDGSIAAIVHEGDCGGQTPRLFGFDRQLTRDHALAPKAMTTLAAYDELANREGGIDGIDAYRIDTQIVEGGRHPFVVANGHAYRYVYGKAMRMPVIVSTEASDLTADAASRIWGVACGHVVIATREPPQDLCD